MNLRLLLTLGLACLLFVPSAGAQTAPAYGGQSASPYGTQSASPYGGGNSMQSMGQTGASTAGVGAQNTAGALPSNAGGATLQSVGLDTSLPPALPVTTDHALLYPTVSDYVLQPGDLISIRIFGESDFVPTLRIDSFGQASLPFLGQVQLAGLTAVEAQEKLARMLSEGYYVNPQVIVTILEGSGAIAAVTGDLHAVIPVFGSRRLIEVLAAAGGLGPNSSHVITITRPSATAPIVVDLGVDPLTSPEANVPILPGDIVNVSHAGVVFVVGQFKNPGIYPLSGTNAITLTQLTALTGGPDKAARVGDLRLIRAINGKRQFVVLDMPRILLGKAPDPILQPGDILYMPTSPIKDFLTNGTLGSALSIASIVLLITQFTRD